MRQLGQWDIYDVREPPNNIAEVQNCPGHTHSLSLIIFIYWHFLWNQLTRSNILLLDHNFSWQEYSCWYIFIFFYRLIWSLVKTSSRPFIFVAISAKEETTAKSARLAASNLDKYIQNWTNTFWKLDKYILKIGEMNFDNWAKTLLREAIL